MKRIAPISAREAWIAFAWAISVVLALGLGIDAGHKVTVGYRNAEVADLQSQLETANASLADAAIELAFWRGTLRGLAEGGQLPDVDFKDKLITEFPTNGFDDIFYPPKPGRTME